MRVLLDENLPVDFAAELTGHEVSSVVALGWSGIKNGELLKRVGGQFGALVTMDRNIRYQSNLTGLSFGVILVRAPSNRLSDLRPLVSRVLAALERVQAGAVIEVDAKTPRRS